MSPEFGALVHVVPVAGGEPRVLVPTSFREGSTGLDCPAGRRSSSPRCPSRTRRRSTQAIVGGKSRRLLVESPCRRRAGPPPGRERKRRVTWPCPRDGHRLVYSQGTMDWDIWRLDLRRGPATGEAQTRFAPSTKIDANPQFSPDGERVAFTSDRSGQHRDLGRRRARQAPSPPDLSRKGGIRRLPRGGPRTERRSRSTLPRKVGLTWTST